MKASELRDKLNEGLRPDVSGKTTPIERLRPFLEALLTHLEEQEQMHIMTNGPADE